MKPHQCHLFPAFATGGPEVRTTVLLNALSDVFRHTIISPVFNRGESGLPVEQRSARARLSGEDWDAKAEHFESSLMPNVQARAEASVST